MSSEDELVVESGLVPEGDQDKNIKSLKDRAVKEINESLQKSKSLELGEAPPPSVWDIWAVGPYQTVGEPPGRIIELGESAYIVTVVFLNSFMNTNVISFGGKVRLDFHTANTQTMQPVPAMYDSCCFEPGKPDIVLPFGALYIVVRKITPTEAACLLETNICARICNCKYESVPGYAAFVRWVANLDYDLFFPPVGFQFDHPIRYLVYDNDDDNNCDCPEDC